MKLWNWLIEPYTIGFTEIKYLRNMESESKQEKSRILMALYANVVIMFMYTFLMIATIGGAINAFFSGWVYLILLVPTIFLIFMVRYVHKQNYLKRRDAFIKNDPTLIKK